MRLGAYRENVCLPITSMQCPYCFTYEGKMLCALGENCSQKTPEQRIICMNTEAFFHKDMTLDEIENMKKKVIREIKKTPLTVKEYQIKKTPVSVDTSQVKKKPLTVKAPQVKITPVTVDKNPVKIKPVTVKSIEEQKKELLDKIKGYKIQA